VITFRAEIVVGSAGQSIDAGSIHGTPSRLAAATQPAWSMA
jgi:hypothetical protein